MPSDANIDAFLALLVSTVDGTKRGMGTPADEAAYRAVIAPLAAARRARRNGDQAAALALLEGQLDTIGKLPRGLAEQAEHHYRQALGVAARLAW